MLRTQLVVAFLLGAVVALGAALITGNRGGLPEAYAQQSSNNDIVALMGTMNSGKGPNDNIYVVDSKALRLAIYKFNGQTLELAAVRNMQYDLKFEEFAPGGAQKPTVEQVRDATRNEDKQGPKKK